VTDHDRPARALLLDLDGTIADTLPHIFDAFRHAVAPWVEPAPTDAEIEARFGPPERECLALFVPAADVDAAEERFHAFYESRYAAAVAIVEGVEAAIDDARARGWRVGIFTGKGRRSATFTLRELGIWDRVECLVSGDDVVKPKPDAEGVHVASRALGVPVPRILLAGDSPADVRAGRDAGCRVAAVLWAAFQPDRLRHAGADFVCDRVADLVAAIAQLDAEG
jgi:HAD superfamily hydrolase (TIGR01509 family)